MWPVENNAQLQARLERQVRPARIDPLLNTVTTTDRESAHDWSGRMGQVLAAAGKFLSLRRHSPAPTAAMLRRLSHS